MTSKPAAASGSMTRQKMRLVSGQPWTHDHRHPADALVDVGLAEAARRGEVGGEAGRVGVGHGSTVRHP